jgi:hypothetical protein
MRRLAFMFGLALGFVLGSRAGTQPYEQLVSKVRSITNQPEVLDAFEEVKAAAKDRASDAVAKADEALDDAARGTSSNGSSASSTRSTAESAA